MTPSINKKSPFYDGQYDLKASVNTIQFSPASSVCAVGCADGNVHLLSIEPTITPLRLLSKQHNDQISSVKFSPDGSAIAAASWDSNVSVWDTNTGKRLTRYTKHELAVVALAYHPHNNPPCIASGGENYDIHVWNPKSGKLNFSIDDCKGIIYSISFSPSGKYIAYGELGTIQLVDAKNGKPYCSLGGHSESILSLTFNPSIESSIVGSAGLDSTIKLWDYETKTNLHTFLPLSNKGAITSIDYHPTANIILSGNMDSSVRLYDLDKRRMHSKLKMKTKGPIQSVAFSLNGQYAAAGSFNNMLHIWTLPPKIVYASPSTPIFSQVDGSIPTKIFDFYSYRTPSPFSKQYNMLFQAGKTVFEIEVSQLVALLTKKGNIFYECLDSVPETALEIRKSDVKKKQYFNTVKITDRIGLVEKHTLVDAIRRYKSFYKKHSSANKVAFSKALIFKLVDSKKQIKRVSSLSNELGAYHCQPQTHWNIYELKEITRKGSATRKRKSFTPVSPLSNTRKARKTS